MEVKWKLNGNGSEPIICPLCDIHYGTECMAFQYPIVNANFDIKGKYDDIFLDDIPKDLVICAIL